jgi:hypothetical protein
MQLRSSRIIGIPKHSYTMTNIPTQTHGMGQKIMLILSSIFIGFIIIFIYVFYILFYFYRPLHNDMFDPSLRFNWSNLLFDAI